jgi:hypothetical protein
MQRAMLSVAGSDGLISLGQMMDHLWVRFPNTSRDVFIREVEESLLKLQRLGNVYLERQSSNDRRPMTFDEWDRFSLLNFVEWDSDIQRWRVNAQQPGVEDVFMQISQGGLNDLRLYEAQAKEIIAESE